MDFESLPQHILIAVVTMVILYVGLAMWSDMAILTSIGPEAPLSSGRARFKAYLENNYTLLVIPLGIILSVLLLVANKPVR